ncbi:nitronate monooxygenase [Nocardia puris]|uniref:Probable nitronate monooxygenase n=1 Tax=Nocardia puris TaxID=208602 RepID=A0A366DAU4_9NOCA|nr:nitronate monooxygenase [Nocardia puris]MBF6214047.1 nitronate monooxygenase [Nocardia puris]MBF6368669.1 nitronate monooxygenase [Nocardia puris]MBF6461571.1 nitronate monooxygenase [Nocardia puris]RBO86554.1 nitronate monooxygenase [Nocardia puris]
MNRFTTLLGIDVPIVQGPFGGGLSSVDLLAAVSEGGGLGSFGAHVLTGTEIADVVARARAATERPFAVNLWVPQPGEPTGFADADRDRLARYYTELEVAPPDSLRTPDYEEQLAAVLAAAPPCVSFVMGIPDAGFLAAARERGIVTLGTATTVEEAIALERAGFDAVVASGSDAGGHRGAFLRPVHESLVGTFSLIPQVADAVRVPVVAAGGIADGRGIAAAFALGADAVQIGTGFLATDQSGASAPHRRALRSPDARTTVLTRLFSGRPARGIPNRFVREMAQHEATVPPYPAQNALMGPLRRRAAANGDAGLLNLWSGQAALLAGAADAGEYLRQLRDQTRASVERLNRGDDFAGF